ncbi:hypothetical protein DICVIV_02981 [Dictyocaulus viviparus]|uniref:Uncharacterized protein n=1 Tax=Dictyocaulus viviparus TaxID=29172 RepID=A0A0D8Y8D0_DICVI|nr:hypothetical protein DICVIV_02981 [Dictyocaulus viviparus]
MSASKNLCGSNEIVTVSDSQADISKNESSQLNDDIQSGARNEEKEADKVEVISNNEKKSELTDSIVLDRTVDGLTRLSLNRSELCDSLSSSIMQLMEVTSPQRRRSSPFPINRYELNESLLEDSESSMPKSPRTHQERFMTRMPNSTSPRLRLDNEFDDITQTIAKETMRVMTDAVISDVDREIAELELRRSVSTFDEKDASFDPPSALDDSYEDLFTIKKPPSLFEKYPCTSEAEVAASTERVCDNLLPSDKTPNRSIDYVEEVNSPEWMKKKCSCYAKEIWRLINLKGYIRPIFDEFISPPVLEDDLYPLNEGEQLIVKNKSMLIWSSVIELAAMLWPESLQNRNLICSKWWPIPECEAEFSRMAQRYMFEQFSDLPPSHRYKRLSRPWACENPETYLDDVVARYLYSDAGKQANFTRKVRKEYSKICEELIEEVGDRFISSEVQQMQNSYVVNDDGSEGSAILGRRSNESFDNCSGKNGRPSLTRFSIDSVRSAERCSSIGATSVLPLRIVSEECKILSSNDELE